jgi:hypothetical protein
MVTNIPHHVGVTVAKMHDLINATMDQFVPVFELAWPIELRIKRMRKYMGLYEEKFRDCEDYSAHTPRKDEDWIRVHRITISYANCLTDRGIRETVVHELVHCWQNEDGRKTGHKKDFRRWAKYLKKEFGLYINKVQEN